MMADEYIRREDFIQHLEKCKKGAAVTNLVWAAIMAIERDVRDMPAADVAPVVRCKDCEHARDLGFQFGSLAHESWFCIYNGPHTTGANDFCSHGQKREKGELEDDP
jgi:hypothetical protein